MTVSKKKLPPEHTDWQLEFVRLIALPAPPLGVRDQTWWRDLVGELPEDYILTSKKDSREERGTYEGASLSLTYEYARITWHVRHPITSDPMIDYPTFKEPYRERINWFVKLVNSWLTTSCPPLIRLAFSAKLLHPASSAKEAYQLLAAHLPIVKLDPNPNDFFLQINRRKDRSEVVDSLPINRVSSWSKLNLEFMIEYGRPFKFPEECFSALELDINTALEKGQVLPRDLYPRLFQELTDLGVDIAERGDTP